MRTARRDGSVADLATDSVTSPEKMASRGTTTPSTRVATKSLAWTLVPTGVVPAATFCRMITGNSSAPEETGRGRRVLRGRLLTGSLLTGRLWTKQRGAAENHS